jgi:hypothetical protein
MSSVHRYRPPADGTPAGSRILLNPEELHNECTTRVHTCIDGQTYPCLAVRDLGADAALGLMAEARVQTARPAVREGSSSANAAPPEGKGPQP